MYMLMRPSYRNWLIFFPCLLITLLFPFTMVAAEKIYTLSVNKNNVTWKHLSFKGKELFAKLNVDVELISQTAAELDATFISSPQGASINVPESGAYVIKTKTSVKSAFLPKVKLQNVAWFDPNTLSTMQYIRKRTGFKDAIKIYRFTDKGVFKLTKQPIDEHEALQAPEKWSVAGERFYTYTPAKVGCMDITVPMPIIYFISASKTSDFDKNMTVCIFNKKEVIYLDIQKESVEPVQLEYAEIRGDYSSLIKKSFTANVLSLKARAIDTGKTMNNFTLAGLQGNIKIYINPETRVPVQLKGNYKGLGEIKLKLRQMVHK